MTTNFSVSPEVVVALQEATRKRTSTIKVEIVADSLVPVLTIPCKGTTEEDFDHHVRKYAVAAKPCFFLFRLNEAEARPKWLLVSWSPDEASVRDKVLYAGSHSILAKALPAGSERKEYFASTMGELKYEEFLKSGEFDPAVMTEVERARESEKTLPTDTRTRSICMPAIAPVAGKLDVPAAVAQAMSAKMCLLLTLRDDALHPKQLTWEKFSANLPETPAFLLTANGHTFIYWCPEALAVKVKFQSAVAKATVFETVKEYFQKQGKAIPREVEIHDEEDVGKALQVEDHHAEEPDIQTLSVRAAQRPSLARGKPRQRPRQSFIGEFDF
jgi:hypothetical protein